MRRDDEVDRVLEHLRRRIKRSDLSQRRIEELCGFSKGYLSQLLARNLDLKVWHVLAMLDVLDVTPPDFFLELYPSRQYPALEEFRRMARPLSDDTDRLLEGLYQFGVDSLRDLRGRLERCEQAIGQLRGGELAARGGAPDRGE